MLGKRPRTLQRTRSKLQLMKDDKIEPSDEKLRPLMPVFEVSRQVIGFKPVSRDLDAGESPRSVLSGVESGCSQVRSPRSGLDSLLSSSGPWVKRGSEEASQVPSNAVEEAADNSTLGTSKALMIMINQPQVAPKHSKPIAIGSPHALCSALGKKDQFQRMQSNDTILQDSDAWSLRGLQSYTNKQDHTSLCGSLADMEMETSESIFWTASPSSSCSENCGLLLEIDFLNACYFCARQLVQGKDIYMYRGDRAFCSVECRYQQIVLDERKERCAASVPSASAKTCGRPLTATPTAIA